MLRTFIVTSALAMSLAIMGCDRAKPAASSAPTARTPSGGTPAAPAGGALPQGLFLATTPADAKDVKDAKPTLKAGDKVVLVGRIGGSDEPFVAERAMFTLVDRRLKACGEGAEKDSCKTPWDYCCEAREEITANSATVQVLGADGQPAKAELNGVSGLKPLAVVTVVGTVAKTKGENVVVNASGFFVGH